MTKAGWAAAIMLAQAAMAAPLTIPYQLTHALNYDPSPSPDGKRLVFIKVLAGKEQLFVMNADGSGEAQITHDDIDHEDPAWSPKGDKIAFVAVRPGQEVISVMNTDGSSAEALTPPEVRAIHPSWSSDGRKLIYCTDDDLHPPKKNASDIDVVDIATKTITRVITGGVNTYPEWSPDMKHIVFRRMIGEMNSEVFVADADGRNARNLTNHPAFDGWPAWSPDGRRIAFASNRGGHGYQIFVMAADGSNPRLVANTEGRGAAPRWSPDGGTIYFPNCTDRDYGVDCEIMAARLPP